MQIKKKGQKTHAVNQTRTNKNTHPHKTRHTPHHTHPKHTTDTHTQHNHTHPLKRHVRLKEAKTKQKPQKASKTNETENQNKHYERRIIMLAFSR